MDLNIGTVIVTKRKAKSWTQEQLANAVGVSTPAVSKWETGTSYPDITLLSPIARALNITVDELLSYQNELSADDVDTLAKKASQIYETEGFESGWNFCQSLIQEYPNSIPLKFYLGNLFQNFLILKPNLQKQEIQSYYRQSVNTYTEVLSSGHPKFSYSATIILVGFHLMLNETDRAEKLLDSLPKIKTDPAFLYPSIYAFRGEKDAAVKLIQDNIKNYLPKISQSLSFLCAFERQKNNMETAYTLAEINLKMTELFNFRKELAYPDIIKILVLKGRHEEAFNYLEAFVQTILDWSQGDSENPVFSHLAPEANNPNFIKKVLAQTLLTDRELEPLASDPRYSRIVDKLRDL